MRVIRDDRRLPKLSLQVISGLGWICVLYLAWVVGVDSWERTMFSFQAMSGTLPEVGPFDQRYADHPWWTLAHTVPGLLFAVLGPLQFVGPVRRSVPLVHRITGRVIVVIGIAAGISAFVMTFLFPTWGMPFNMVVTAAMSAFMVFAFVNAYRHVMARRFSVHREWMIRGFTTGLAVAYFRVMLNDVLPRMAVESFSTRWNIAMPIAFPIMIAVAELWIRATRPETETTAAAADTARSATPA